MVLEVVGEPARHVGRVRHVTLSDRHVPQRKFGFRVAKEVRLHLRGLTYVDERLLPVTAAQQPTGAFFMTLAFTLAMVGPAAAASVADWLGLGAAFARTWQIVRWPAALPSP